MNDRTSKPVDVFHCQYPNNCACCPPNHAAFLRLRAELAEMKERHRAELALKNEHLDQLERQLRLQSETSRDGWMWKYGVIHFHSIPGFADRLHHIIEDCRAAGVIADIWLNDFGQVLKEFGYKMTITRAFPERSAVEPSARIGTSLRDIAGGMGCSLCDSDCPVDSEKGMHYWAIHGTTESGFTVDTRPCEGKYKLVAENGDGDGR